MPLTSKRPSSSARQRSARRIETITTTHTTWDATSSARQRSARRIETRPHWATGRTSPSSARQRIVAHVVKTQFWPDIRRSRTGFGHERLNTGTTMIDADVREIMPDMSCPPPLVRLNVTVSELSSVTRLRWSGHAGRRRRLVPPEVVRNRPTPESGRRAPDAGDVHCRAPYTV